MGSIAKIMAQQVEKTKGRIYAIPDIHGRFDLLAKLMTELVLGKEKLDQTRDKVVFLGDMVDRGPSSKQVLEYLRNLQLEAFARDCGPVVTVLKGNHENLMLKACESGKQEDWLLWRMNGGDATVDSFGGEVDAWMLIWVSELPTSHRIQHENGQEFFFSHAPVPRENRRVMENKGMPFTEQELTWSYPGGDEFGWARNHGENVIGVCGHIHGLGSGNVEYQPRFYDHYIYCDSGCGCHPKAPLVAVEVVSRRVISAWPAATLKSLYGR